jgi:hypothetical protein
MRQTPRSIAAIALLAVAVTFGLGLAACNSEPTCEKAIDRVLELVKAEQSDKLLAKFPESERKKLAEMMERSLPRERLVKDCQQSFTREQIACMVAAKSLEEASKCNQAAIPTGVTPTPGAAPDQPAQGATPDQPTGGATPGAAGGSEATGAGAPPAAPQEPAPTEPAQPAQPQ